MLQNIYKLIREAPEEAEIEMVFSSEKAAASVYDILISRPLPVLNVKRFGLTLVFGNRKDAQESVEMLDEAWPEEDDEEGKSPSWRENLKEVNISQPPELSPAAKEQLEETMEVPYSDLVNKYTEDEIWDIARGRKTDVSPEEIEMAKFLIEKGIVAGRLSMKKTAQKELEDPFPEPQTSKQKLFRLYKQEAKGIYDEELMDEIIMDFIITSEAWISWYEQELEAGPENPIFTGTHLKIFKLFIDILQSAKTPQEKMIAIDKVINTIHQGGVYGEYLVRDVFEQPDPFFDELSNLKISGLNFRKTAQSTLETIQKAQAGEGDAIAQVIEENMGLITKELSKWGYSPESEEFEDVVSDIKIEMINRIIPQYNPSKGAFSTLLTTAIYNFLRRGTRQKEYKERQKEVSLTEPVGEEITLEDTLEEPREFLPQITISSARESLQNWIHIKNPELENLILRIFDLKVEADYSHDQIVEILNEEGFKSKGKPITRFMVNNYVNIWIKPILHQYFESFRSAFLSMRVKKL